MLLRYAREHHFPNPTFFVDDGVSGVTYDRSGFQAMLAEIEAEFEDSIANRRDNRVVVQKIICLLSASSVRHKDHSPYMRHLQPEWGRDTYSA